jgi:hypothetical protein
LHVTSNGAQIVEWDSPPEVYCDGKSAHSGIARFTLRDPGEWPLQLRLLLLRKGADGHVIAFFEDVSFFHPTSFDDSLEWRWPPPPPSPASAAHGDQSCGILHLVDTTFTFGCAVGNYSDCHASPAVNSNADTAQRSCGLHVGVDDVTRFLQKRDSRYVLVNDRCSQQQSRQSSLDARQQLHKWTGAEAPSPCSAFVGRDQSNFSAVVTLFTDYMVARVEDLRRLHPAEIVGVWLVEPRSICPSCYQYVVDNMALFDIVLSHDIQFLSDIKRRHPKGSSAAVFVPFASSLLLPPSMSLNQEIKSQLVSCFLSDKRMLIGHVLRHAIYHHADLRGRVHFFGQGAGREIRQKTEAMAPYMFHIVIENSRIRGYYSEKLIDCFLTGSIPLYWGGELPSAFDRMGVITWNTVDDLVDVVSSLSADVYWARHGAVIRNFKVALSGPYTNTLQLAWNTHLLPLAVNRAKELEDGLGEASKLFENASKTRSEESLIFVSEAASAVRLAVRDFGQAKRLASVHFWIVVYVDITTTIGRLERCLRQLQAQTHSSWHAVVIVDPSAYALQSYRETIEYHAADRRLTTWVSFDTCKSKLDCILLALNESSSTRYDESVDPVCIFLQGRDSLLSSDSLVRIAELYSLLNCWVTYGSSVLFPSMILEASRDSGVDAHFFPASVYERNTVRTTEWLRGRPPFFTLLRSVMRKIPSSHSRLPGDHADPSLALLVAAVELAGDRVVPLIRVVHERCTSRNFWDAAAGGSEIFHSQAAWAHRETISQLPPLRRLPGARMVSNSSIRPSVTIVVKGGLLQPVGTTEVSVSVSASGIWIPEEATLRFTVNGEELAGIGHLHSFVFTLPTVHGFDWLLQAQLLSAENHKIVLAEESLTLEIDTEL